MFDSVQSACLHLLLQVMRSRHASLSEGCMCWHSASVQSAEGFNSGSGSRRGTERLRPFWSGSRASNGGGKGPVMLIWIPFFQRGSQRLRNVDLDPVLPTGESKTPQC